MRMTFIRSSVERLNKMQRRRKKGRKKKKLLDNAKRQRLYSNDIELKKMPCILDTTLSKLMHEKIVRCMC